MADEHRMRCGCANCRVRGLMGPLMLITIGAIFLAAQYTRYSIADLWPVILIVAGVVLVAQSLASRSGHLSS